MTQRSATPRAAVAALGLSATLLAALPARAVTVVDTGTPNGLVASAYAFDATDFYAGRIGFTGAARIDGIAIHLLGGTAGETYTIALQADGLGASPGATLLRTTATYAADGWNGASGLSGWTVATGTYWVAFEIGPRDTLGSGSPTGALLDRGAPSPLARTAFDDGSGYRTTAVALDFGLRVNATPLAAVPEPSTTALLLGGLVGIATIGARRRRR
jgi:PEP-CTERM motif